MQMERQYQVNIFHLVYSVYILKEAEFSGKELIHAYLFIGSKESSKNEEEEKG